MTDLGWLDAIEARLRAATPGPWRNNPTDWLEIWANRDAAGWDAFFIATLRTRLNPDPGRQAAHDASFIAHAPEDIAALVAAVRERDAALARAADEEHVWTRCKPCANDDGPCPCSGVLCDSCEQCALLKENRRLRAALARVEALAEQWERDGHSIETDFDGAPMIRAALAGEGS